MVNKNGRVSPKKQRHMRLGKGPQGELTLTESWCAVHPLRQHSWLSQRRGRGEEPAIGDCSNHIFQDKMTLSNHHPLTLTMSHTHSLSSVSMWQWLSHTAHYACLYRCSSILLYRASANTHTHTEGLVGFAQSIHTLLQMELIVFLIDFDFFSSNSNHLKTVVWELIIG